jgi:hypothetical protein
MKTSSSRVWILVVFGLLLAAGSSGYAIPLPANFHMAGGFNVEVLANTTHYNELGFGDNFSFYFQSNPGYRSLGSTYTGDFTLRLTADSGTVFTGLKASTSGWLFCTDGSANMTQKVTVDNTTLGTMVFQNYYPGTSAMYGNLDATYWSTSVSTNSFLLSFHEEPVSYNTATVLIGTVKFNVDSLLSAPASVPDAFSTAVLTTLGGMLLMFMVGRSRVRRSSPHADPKS